MTTATGLRPQENGARSAAPDQLKALLIVGVIFGHTYAEGLSEDFSKWIIYGIHMPSFLFLSGYLINTERFTSRSFGQFLVHYARRMLIAWAVVSIAWLAWFYPETFRSVRRIVRGFLLEPDFHLWYIPALFIALVLTWLLARSRAGIIAFAVIAAASYLLFTSPAEKFSPLDGLWDDRFLGYLVFFLLGLAVRNGWIPVPAAWIRIVAIVVGAALYLSAFFTDSGWANSIGYLVLNVGLGLSIPAILERLSRPLPVAGRPVQLIGEYSLWVYLLHPFATRLLQVDSGPWILQRAYGAVVTLGILVVSVLLALGWQRLPFSGARRAEKSR